ncbi:hypothetical protein [Nocardiopsis potens]|uniref:hypothetical protein n=1 Tax=Nocardiopsis potens TaxID=1246458 RepID=UPI0003778715|nr:hypothetical protein [Nocardiopsis potens]
MTPFLAAMAVWGLAIAVGGAGVALSALPYLVELASKRKQLSDTRADNPVGAEEQLFVANTADWERETENPAVVDAAATEGEAYFKAAGADFEHQAGIEMTAKFICDDLQRRGALETGWHQLKDRDPEQIEVRPVRGRLTRREAKKFQKYLRSISAGRRELRRALGSLSLPGLEMPQVTLEQVQREGLPGFRDWLSSLMRGYSKTVDQLAEKKGWDVFLGVLREREHLGGRRLPRRSRIQSADPRSLPGKSPGKEEFQKKPLGSVKPNGRNRWFASRRGAGRKSAR